MRTRSIRSRNQRRTGKEPFEVDITSLLDILVILLVFLLKSYSTSGIIINIPEGVVLPSSQSKTNNNPGVMIQVSPEKIWVDDEEVLNTADTALNGQQLFSHEGRLITALYDALVKKKEEIDVTASSSPQAKPFSGIANFVVDKTLKYDYIKKLMYTTAEAGFKEYKFVVMGQAE